jgi:hypothetical protein
MSDEEEGNDISWNDRLEEYFASTGEKAHCLSWLHKKAEALYSFRTMFIDLPVIILSTLTGAASIGSKSLFGESEIAPVALGVISLFVSLLNTIGTYFSWARRSESHRVSYLQYSKMYRFLNVEMSLPRDERMKPKDLLKYIRDEYERLNEISPLIPPNLIKIFNDKFGDEKEISQPEEVNGLERIIVYNPPPAKVEVEVQTPSDEPPPPEEDLSDSSNALPNIKTKPLTKHWK